jgi:elongation factor P
MANVPLKRGMLLRHQNHIYEVADFSERHTGKQKGTVHVALRDIRDGRPVDRTLSDLMPVELVESAYRRLQYLYSRGESLILMDAENFEEHEFPASKLGNQASFMVEGIEYRGRFIDGALASLEVPDIVSLRVEVTAPAEHSVGSSSNITKEALLESGLEVRVPLFIKTGDVIKVDTRTKSYAGKDHA